MSMLPLSHLTVKHEYSSGNWDDFTSDLASADITLRELPGQDELPAIFLSHRRDTTNRPVSTRKEAAEMLHTAAKSRAG